ADARQAVTAVRDGARAPWDELLQYLGSEIPEERSRARVRPGQVRARPGRRSGPLGDGALPVVRHLERPRFDDADVVAERVADREVDAVRAVPGLLADRHALGPQVLAGGAGVVGHEADRQARRALRHPLAALLGGVAGAAGPRHAPEAAPAVW